MITYDRKKMGQTLRQKRVAADFTQAEAARSLGYTSPQFLSNIERGISVVPIETLGKLIRLYEFDGVAVVNLIMLGEEEALRRVLKKPAVRRSR